MYNETAGQRMSELENEMIGLFQSLEVFLPDQPHPVIQFISSHRGEGVTTISRTFATITAQIFGKSVLVLDAADGQKKTPDSVETLPRKNESKVAGNENRNADAMSEKPDNRLDLPPADKLLSNYISPKNADGFYTGSLSDIGTSIPVVFSANYYKNYVNVLREKFDFIIIDSPPVSESVIGLTASPRVNGVVLVVAAETTRWPVVARVKERIEKGGGRILGVVLNKQKHYIPRIIYKHIL